MPEIDKASFRTVLGHFASGVTVMTTSASGQLHGMTVSAFASVSLTPLLILVSVERSTEMHRLVGQSRVFAISILGNRAEATSRFFADNARLEGPEFHEGGYRLGTTGSPILNQATAYLEARVHALHEAGDHSIVIGEVIALGVNSEEDPLIYYRSGYRTLGG